MNSKYIYESRVPQRMDEMAAPEPFPLIDLSGSPRQRGLAYGAQARERIGRSIALYRGQIQAAGCEPAQLAAFAGDFVGRIRAWSPEIVTEMEAIAEGAGVDALDIVLVNARTELVQLARRRPAIAAPEPEGCTGVVVMPERSASGELLHGQTWDWLAECARTGVVLRIRRDDGPDILTFTEAGGMARNGFNSAGIAITANYLESDRDYLSLGIPLSLIRRRALEQTHFADSIRIVATTPKSTSNNMILSSVHGFAVDLECAPDETFAITPEEGLIVHANHWQSPVALAKLREMGIRNMPDSLYRDYRVRQHLRGAGARLDMDDIRAAFSDDFGAPFSVCRPPIPGISGNLSATVATVLFRPAAGLMEITPLPAVNARSTTYSLEMEASVKALLPDGGAEGRGRAAFA